MTGFGVVNRQFVPGTKIEYKPSHTERFKVSHRVVVIEACTQCGQVYWLPPGAKHDCKFGRTWR